MNKPIKILVVRFSSIGDIVLTTPVVRCLKQQLPSAQVHFCTKQKYNSLVINNPYIDKCYLLDSSLYELICQLQAEEYDYVVDLHNNFRTALIKLALNVRCFAVDKLNLRKWVYISLKADVMPNQHVVDRYLNTVLKLGVKDDGLGLNFFIHPSDHVDINNLPATHHSGYVAYVIGGQYVTKRLPVWRMIELCQKIGGPVVLLGGDEDRQAGDQVIEALGSELVYNACGLYNLSQSASLLGRARVVFSHDTGLMHIAAALKKKVYSIWGNTTPQLGMYPYGTSYVVLEKTGLGCRPCSKIGFGRCPMGHFRCMNEVEFSFDPNKLLEVSEGSLMPTT